MTVLMFLSGFIYNLISMAINCLPMSYDIGMYCMIRKQWVWETDEQDLLDQLDKGDPFDGDDKFNQN